MKTIITYLFLLVFTLTFLSCEEKMEKDIETGVDINNFEFDNLMVGDVMLYSYVTGVDYPSQNSDATYTGDTLELTVVDEVDGKFIIQEQITPNSAIFDSDIKYIRGQIEEKHELLWDITEDSIIISTLESEGNFESHIFPHARSLSLTAETETKVEFEGCRTTIPYSQSFQKFFIENGELLDITYPHLNGYLNYSSMALDGDGLTFIYSKESGFVRVTSTSGWTANVWGWDRIN